MVQSAETGKTGLPPRAHIINAQVMGTLGDTPGTLMPGTAKAMTMASDRLKNVSEQDIEKGSSVVYAITSLNKRSLELIGPAVGSATPTGPGAGGGQASSKSR